MALSTRAAVLPVFSPDPAAATGASDSYAPIFSGDGRTIVFLSMARNLTDNDLASPWIDVFLHNISEQTNCLISVRATGTGGGNDHSHSPSISSNGQFVVWASAASNLAPNSVPDLDQYQEIDIYLRDLESGVTQRITVSLDGSEPALGDKPAENLPLCAHPLISADGAIVAFESLATNLTACPDTNRASDVFCWHRLEQTNHLVSTSLVADQAANGPTSLASVSADGRRILLLSSATDLAPDSANSRPQVYLFDHDTQASPQDRLVWLSRDADNLLTNQAFFHSSVLAESGQAAVFKAILPAQTNAYLFHYDLDTEQTTMLTNAVSDYDQVTLSADGKRVAYFDGQRIWLWDQDTQERRLITQTPSPQLPGQHRSHSPALSRDGSVICFLSSSISLVTNDTRQVTQAFRQDLESGETQLISVGTDGTASRTSLEALPPSISPNGQLIAFESRDANLVAGDFNAGQDIFLRDTLAAETRLVSHRHARSPSLTGGGWINFTRFGVSGNGNWIAYNQKEDGRQIYDQHWLGNLRVANLQTGSNVPLNVPDVTSPFESFILTWPVFSFDGRYLTCRKTTLGTDFYPHNDFSILWFDLVQNQQVQISIARNSTQSLEHIVIKLERCSHISQDGRFLVFHSGAHPSTYVPNYTGNFSSYDNVYLVDLFDEMLATRVISLNRLGNSTGNGNSIDPLLSPNSAWVIFQSAANSLVTNSITSPYPQLFVAQVAAQTIQLISYDLNGFGLTNTAEQPVFSGNSRYVIFQATPSFSVYRHHLSSPEAMLTPNELVCANCWQPSTDVTGNLVAYASRDADGQVYVVNMESGHTELISATPAGAPSAGPSFEPQLSPDGRYVLFTSTASDLVANDLNRLEDVFLRDRILHITYLLSRTPNGSSGNHRSVNAVLAADGRTAIFRSFASDLIPGDFNNTADVFFIQLSGEDSDADGLEDEWELAYFQTLNRDGSADFDQDGVRDAGEFKAGTDPTNGQSIFRVLALQRLGGDEVQLIWAAVPGKSYQVEYAAGVEEPEWLSLPGIVVAEMDTASRVDAIAGGDVRRFYRVRLLE